MSFESVHAHAESVEQFAANIAQVQQNIWQAAQRAGRAENEIRLLPVSKTVPEDRLRLAVQAGCHSLGENKVQEAKRKASNLADLQLDWALIGHLQTNKVKDVVSFATEFHALDSLRVADTLERRLQQAGRSLDVYIQVNTSGEESKYGLAPAETLDFLQAIRGHDSLRVRGLMTLAVFSADASRVRDCFKLLRELRDQARQVDPDLVGAGELSMGMSGDYEIAIEEGANVVRVGQAIFGARPTTDADYWPGFAG